MENQNLNQYQNQKERIEPKIRVSRDGKWVIEKIPRSEIELFLQNYPDSDVVIIKAAAYFEKIIESAKSRSVNAPVNVEKIKG